MRINIGFSTSINFWRPKKVIAIAAKYKVGVEVINFRWHKLSDYDRWFAAHPDAELLGIHGCFFGDQDRYIPKIMSTKQALRTKLIEIIFLYMTGNPRNNKSAQIAEAKKCYLNCHVDGLTKARTKVLVENLPRKNNYNAQIDVKDFAVQNNIGTTLDTSHIGADGSDLLEEFHRIDPVVIHLSDTKYGHDMHLVPGTGDLPLRDLIKAVKTRDKDTTITIELAPVLYGVEKNLKKSLDYVNQCLA